MEPDPVLVSNTREWLLRAKEDLDNARHDPMATPPFVRDALFHFQQGVEKAMKAFLTWHDSTFRRTHDLEELGELCIRMDGTLAPAVEQVTPLTEYAARFRYPGAPWEPALQEARESIELARTFVHTVLRRFPARIADFDDHPKDSMESGV
jgi:HEPN domain-containing protein